LTTHSAPGGKIWTSCRVVGEQLDGGADAHLSDVACYLDDRSWTFHSATIQRQSFEW
jgi:hypothetical protein